MGKNVTRFKQTTVPKQGGELARLKVMGGPELGSIFVVTFTKISVGRGEECDVAIPDLKISRKHFELSYNPQQGWALNDLGSANGVQVNGKWVRASVLKPGDLLTLGDTTFEFVTPELGTAFITAPVKNLEQAQAEQAHLESHKQRVRSFTAPKLIAQAQVPAANDAEAKKKKLLLAAVAVGAVYFLFFDTPKKKPVKKAQEAQTKKDDASRNLAQYLPQVDTTLTQKTIDQFVKTGFREFRNRNYLRARQQFETVLQMAPGHPLASLYLENCNKAIEEDVKRALIQGKKALDSGKLKEARGSFEYVLRQLYRDQSSPNYLEAKEQLDRVRKELEGGGA